MSAIDPPSFRGSSVTISRPVPLGTVRIRPSTAPAVLHSGNAAPAVLPLRQVQSHPAPPAIQRARGDRVSAGWKRLFGGWTPFGRNRTWTAKPYNTLSHLPLPTDDVPRVLAARVNSAGVAEFRWRKKEDPPAGELALAKKHLEQLLPSIEPSVLATWHADEIPGILRRIHHELDACVTITPGHVKQWCAALQQVTDLQADLQAKERNSALARFSASLGAPLPRLSLRVLGLTADAKPATTPALRHETPSGTTEPPEPEHGPGGDDPWGVDPDLMREFKHLGPIIRTR